MRAVPRALAIASIVLLLAIGAWLALGRDPAAPPQQGPDAPAAGERRDVARDAEAERVAVASSPAAVHDRDDDAGAEGSAPAAGEAGAEPAAPPATVLLRVHDLAAREVVPEFRWRFVPERGGAQHGAGQDGRAGLPLGDGAGFLLVEAEGFLPASQRVESLPPPAPAQQLDVFLTRTAPLTGVTLAATAPDGAPVERLRIDLWQSDPGTPTPPGTDPDRSPLWTRIGVGENGTFRLPDVEPGDYLLRAQPCGEDGAPLPLLPWRTGFAFTGGNAVPLAHAFAPGCVLRLEAPARPGPPVECRVVVRAADGSEIESLWRSTDGTGAAVVSRRTVLLPGVATVVLALPSAVFAVEVTRQGTPLPLSERPQDGSRVRTFDVRVP